MRALRRATDRFTECPSCRREARVTDDELAAGRSFCAACGERFAVTEENIGDSPHRTSAMIQADKTRPPPNMAVREDRSIVVTERGARGRTAMNLAGLAYIVYAFASLALKGSSLIYAGVVAACFLPLTWLLYGTRDVIRRDGDNLVIARGPGGVWKRRIPIADIEGITADADPAHLRRAVTLTRRRGKRVVIARNRVGSDAEATWLTSHLNDLLRLRSGEE